MTRHELTDEHGPFDVTLFEGLEARSVVLFSVGGGGNPERHLPLLSACAAQGFTVVAPHFERLLGPTVSDEALRQRAHRLRLALDIGRPPDAPVVGIGHSIGATTLLALAGARVTMQNGQRLFIEREPRLQRLALMAPATQFFGPPGSLDAVQVAILAWAGTKDTITPPAQAELLERSLRGRIPVDLRVEDGAGHFSFMHLPPPHVPEPLANREAFLDRLTAAVVMFAEG